MSKCYTESVALTVSTSNAASLLAAIKKAIDEKRIETWAYDKDGDFTHTPPQWLRKAWLRPKISGGALRFGIVGRQQTKMTKEIYAVYHGRFIEMLLAHFDGQFDSALATAQMDVTIESFD